MLHPTLNPVPPACAEPDDARRAQARADLARISNPEMRTVFALGYLSDTLQAAVCHQVSPGAHDAIMRALAMLAAVDELDREASRYRYDREDVVNPHFVLPPGIDGWAIPRSTK